MFDDVRCSICGAEEESINHVLFKCPSVLQTWALSNIPSVPGIFPTSSVFANMDYLFWRLPKEYDFSNFPWILWYIWKNRNNKVFNNKDGNPQEILRIAEVEGEVWTEAQLTIPERQHMVSQPFDWRSSGHSKICFVDGAWKETYKFSGQGWFCRDVVTEEKMMGAMNL